MQQKSHAFPLHEGELVELAVNFLPCNIKLATLLPIAACAPGRAFIRLYIKHNR